MRHRRVARGEARGMSEHEWQTVSFCCYLCGGPLLYVQSWGDGRVELSVPGPRLSVRHRLRDPSYIDQRATGIAVERDGYEREPSVTRSGSVVVS